MADYTHGKMDITEQTKTFNGFVKFVTWAVAVIFFVLLFLAVFAS